jgi:hypothetical protein
MIQNRKRCCLELCCNLIFSTSSYHNQTLWYIDSNSMKKSKQLTNAQQAHDKKLKQIQWQIFATLYFSFVAFTAARRR